MDNISDWLYEPFISVMPGEWTLQVSFAYVCGKTPTHFKIAAIYEKPSEEDMS